MNGMMLLRKLTPGFLLLTNLLAASMMGAAAQTAPSGSPPIVPDPALTPGATLPVTKDDICRPGYSKAVRNVPSSVKRQVYAEYGILHHARGEYEVDHLISLELGGSNDIKNLWPESYKTQPWNAHVKDQIEDRLHEMVCSGEIDLATAQHEIATDWIGTYKRVFHTDAPLASLPSSKRYRRRTKEADTVRRMDDQPDTDASTTDVTPAVAPSAASSASQTQAQVWVNTRSKKYFYTGSRYYGKTKEGEYMTESTAIAAGYSAAKAK